MCRGIRYAPAVLVALVVVMPVTARAAPAAADAPAAVDGGGEASRRFDLGEADEAPADLFSPSPLDFVAAAPEPEEKPVVVPLPPALGPGLAGLASLAAVRVGRRVCRRR